MGPPGCQLWDHPARRAGWVLGSLVGFCDVPLSPATVALLRSVKASQAVERLKAASIWVETGLVFTTERGTAVDPRNALRAISTAA